MKIKCSECQKIAIDYLAYSKWLMLSNYVYFQYLQGEITEDLYTELTNSLLGMKYLVDQADERALKDNE